MRIYLLPINVCLLAITVGCSPSAPPAADGVAPTSETTAVPRLSDQVGLELVSIQDLPTQLAARQGKVVVLDMWATW